MVYVCRLYEYNFVMLEICLAMSLKKCWKLEMTKKLPKYLTT